ncbi:MAG TPA: amino acid permease [Solirubrobacterales bacterium]|nr:amino acid permease [Solirubrobacterales bacterium]
MSGPTPDRGNLDAILATAEHDRTRLNSSALGAFSLTLLGVASVVGAGIFVVTGDAAAHYAGPAVLISFILAGIVAALTALCYAELASMIPAAGSTYSYAFAAFGSFVGWFIGWDLLLEYLFAASTVAVGWSGYFDSLLDSFGVHLPHALITAPFGDDPGIINLPAMAIMFLTSGALWLGTRESAVANNLMVLLKLSILALVVVVGVFYISSSNFEPFLPASEGGFGDFGWSGVFRGAGIVFFAYIGFDAVSTAAAEARNPRRTVPIGLLGTVIIATTIYIAVGFVLTGMVNYRELGVADPIAVALQAGGRDLDWLLKLTDVAAVVGLASTVLVTLYGQTRIFMRMSEDGMLPPAFGKVSGRTKTPQFSIILCGVVGGIVAGLVPLSVLGELISIGTLLAFIIVSAGVLTLRRRYPDLPRPFRVPALPLVAGTAIVSSLALMATLPGDTWIRLGVWAALGLCVYFLYARAHSKETMGAISAGITSRPEPAPEDA